MTLNQGRQDRSLTHLLKDYASICDLEEAIKQFPSIAIRDVQEYEKLNELVSRIVFPTLVKDSYDKIEREYDSSDFVDILECAPLCFSCLKLLLSKLEFDELNLHHLNGFFVSIFMVCGTHNLSSFPWSSEEAESSVSGILENVVNLTGHKSPGALLCSNIEGQPYTFFKSILLSMRPSLMKDTWTCNASTPHIFRWLLSHVQHPDLVEYLPDVLPPPLMFISHYSTCQKVLGIQCLDHIIDNVPPTELKLYGRADVVYDALFRLVYEKEVEIITVLYPCLVKFLTEQNKNYHTSQKPRKWNGYNEVYHQLLWNMAIESQIKLRRVYSAQLPHLISKMGITVLKHMKRTKQVLLDYLSVYDGPEELSRINALHSLRALIKVAWPRMEHHCFDFLQKILILAYDIESDKTGSDENVRKIILSLCKECMMLLKAACPGKYTECLLPEISETVPELKSLLTE